MFQRFLQEAHLRFPSGNAPAIISVTHPIDALQIFLEILFPFFSDSFEYVEYH